MKSSDMKKVLLGLAALLGMKVASAQTNEPTLDDVIKGLDDETRFWCLA